MSEVTIYVPATIVIMIIAGILGAYCRRIFAQEDSKSAGPNGTPSSFLQIVIPGIVASFIIPLFLSVGKSEVFSDAVHGKNYAENIFIVFAFCLLAAVAARTFVSALARQALQKAEEADEKADEAKELASEEPRSRAPPAIAQDDTKTDQFALSNFQGSEEERSVMSALIDGDYFRRSVTGIAGYTKLDKREVQNVLASLVGRGLVAEGQSKRTGKVLYQAKLEHLVKPEPSHATAPPRPKD